MSAAPLPEASHGSVGIGVRVLVALVRGYRLLLSPSLGNACRFEPTCSAYAIDALQAHGAAAGSYLTLRRIGRCHPWCAAGFDPVPAQPPALFGFLNSSSRQPAPTPPSTPPEHTLP